MSDEPKSLADRILAKRNPEVEPELDAEYEATLLAEKEAELDSLLAEPQPEPVAEALSLVDRILARKKEHK